MRSSFSKSFEKTAFLGALARMASKGFGTVAKKTVSLAGGPLNATLTAGQGVLDAKQNIDKMRQASMR